MKNQFTIYLQNLFPIFLIILAFSGCESKAKEATLSPRFNHVYLNVSDMDRTVTFYTSAFDLKLTKQIKKLKRTTKEGVSSEYTVYLSLLKFPDQDFVLEIGEIPEFQKENSSASYAHLGIDVLDIEAAADRILTAGGIMSRPLSLVETEDIKAKTMFFTGPDGETIELMQIISGDF